MRHDDGNLWYRMIQQRHSPTLAEAVQDAHERIKQELEPVPEFSESDKEFLRELKVKA